jgi:hypothetical protein
MEWGMLVPVAAITVGPVAWVANNWVRARHGYPLEGKKGALVEREGPALRQENAELKRNVERLEARLRVLERIATDPAERTAREIEELR